MFPPSYNLATAHAVVPSVGPRRGAGIDFTVSAIVPARNEAPCIDAVVRGLCALKRDDGRSLLQEVVVADNDSHDGTGALASQAGASVIHVLQPGYGQACWHAVQASHGDVLLFVDGDGAADPLDAAVLLDAVANGADMVVGVRRAATPGAMTTAQRFGNALACYLMRSIWRMKADDLGPYRAIRREAFDALDMQDRSFGWTVEMQVRAHLLGLNVQRRPVQWRPRIGGVSKISGSVGGVLRAGIGILGMIARLWWRERRRRDAFAQHGSFHTPPERAPAAAAVHR